MVVVGVDESDVEASGVEELGELDHGGDMALSWLWDDHSMRPCGRRIHLILVVLYEFDLGEKIGEDG